MKHTQMVKSHHLDIVLSGIFLQELEVKDTHSGSADLESWLQRPGIHQAPSAMTGGTGLLNILVRIIT
jgi:hypothetical protein